MNELSTYLINQCKKIKDQQLFDIKNRLNSIEMNNFFKNSGKQEINNKFVLCSQYSNITPPEEMIAIYNDMKKYKFNKKKK